MPIGVNSAINGETVALTGMVASLDGQTLIRDQCHGPRHTPEAVGRQLAVALKDQGAAAILEEILPLSDLRPREPLNKPPRGSDEFWDAL